MYTEDFHLRYTLSIRSGNSTGNKKYPQKDLWAILCGQIPKILIVGLRIVEEWVGFSEQKWSTSSTITMISL